MKKSGTEDVLVGKFTLLLVGFNKNPSITDEMRVAFGQNKLDGVGINEGDESEHPLLLVWYSHVLHRPVDASKTTMTIIIIIIESRMYIAGAPARRGEET